MTHASDIVERVREVPLLSPSAQQLIGIFGNSAHTLDDTLAVINTDPGLTTSVLRVANSAALGLRTTISTTARAVAYMGEKIVMGIALGSCAAQMYNDPMAGYGGERGDLWRHSLQTAIAAREIAELVKSGCNPGIAYTAGLLHDIGKPLISSALVERKYPVPRNGRDEMRVDHLDWEQQMLGTDHCLVGAMVARHWRLPNALQYAMLYHHAPAETPVECRALTYAVHLGDLMALAEEAGTEMAQLSPDPRYEDYIALTEKAKEHIVAVMRTEFQRTSQMLDTLEGASATA